MTNIEADEIVLPEGRDGTWTRRAIELLQGDCHRYADTHLLKPVFKDSGEYRLKSMPSRA